jgi:hypothetical protein
MVIALVTHPILTSTERRAWALLGHLMANGLLPLPNFDRSNHEAVHCEAMQIHGEVRLLSDWLIA